MRYLADNVTTFPTWIWTWIVTVAYCSRLTTTTSSSSLLSSSSPSANDFSSSCACAIVLTSSPSLNPNLYMPTTVTAHTWIMNNG
ncbi:unnamed protein product [Soboliphyme baturini]|uniref:Secreted protein n=1 Tax=Soboliphyme baturini TaxID=241478 RepID=A0A183JAB6_9BILA|nr:unnamed protein product [Soboliphyme baturini]